MVFGHKNLLVFLFIIILGLVGAQASANTCAAQFVDLDNYGSTEGSEISFALTDPKAVEIDERLLKRIHRSIDVVRSMVSRGKSTRFENLTDLVFEEVDQFSPLILGKVIQDFRITGEDFIKVNIKRYGFQINDQELLYFLNGYARASASQNYPLSDYVPLIQSLTRKADQAELASIVIQDKIEKGVSLETILQEILFLNSPSIGSYYSRALVTNLFNKFSFYDVNTHLDLMLQVFNRYPKVFSQVALIQRYLREFKNMDNSQVLESIELFSRYAYPNNGVLKVGFYKEKSPQDSSNIADFKEFLNEFNLVLDENDYIHYLEVFRDVIVDIEILYGAFAVGLISIRDSEFKTTEKYDLLSTNYLSRLEAVLRRAINIFTPNNTTGAVIDYLLARSTTIKPHYGKSLGELVFGFVEMNEDKGSWDAFFRAVYELKLKPHIAKRIALEVGAGEYIFSEYLAHNGIFRSHEDVVSRIKKNRIGVTRELVPSLEGIVDLEQFNEKVPRTNQELFAFGQAVFDQNTNLLLALSEASRFTGRVQSMVNDLEMAIQNFRMSVSSMRPLNRAKYFNQTKASMVRHFREVRRDISFVMGHWYDAKKIIQELSHVQAIHIITLRELPDEVRDQLDPQLLTTRQSELDHLTSQLKETSDRLEQNISTYEQITPNYDRIIMNFVRMTQDDFEADNWRDLLFQ